jgi:hypothetical protein
MEALRTSVIPQHQAKNFSIYGSIDGRGFEPTYSARNVTVGLSFLKRLICVAIVSPTVAIISPPVMRYGKMLGGMGSGNAAWISRLIRYEPSGAPIANEIRTIQR